MPDPSAGDAPKGFGFGSIPWGNTQDCLMCPFGMFFFAVRNTKPEVMEHLAKAGYELALAMKSVVDQAVEKLEPLGNDLQRIDID
jgi:hypothetical protein